MAGFMKNSSKAKEATNDVCANSDLDEDGVHGGRMKPLSSLGIPATYLSAKLAPSQVLNTTIVGTKARHKTSLYGNGKRSAIIRIQRMQARRKKCKMINRKGSRHGGIEDILTSLPAGAEETPNSKNRAEHLKSTRDKDMDSASNLTCEGLEASTRVLDNIISSSRETALSCFQGQNCNDFTEKEAMPPEDSLVHEFSIPNTVTGLAPEVHLNLAKSGEEKNPLPSTELMKERLPDEFPLTQGDITVNPLCLKSCIDPMLKNTPMSIVKAEDEDEFVACGAVGNATTCKRKHGTNGYFKSSKTTPSCCQFSDVLYDELEGEKCIESFKAESGLLFQASGKYRHAFGTKFSHATCLGSHSVNSSGFTKDIKVENIALERFLTANSKMIKSQQFMGKRGASPQISGDSDGLKQIKELNPGIIAKLRDKNQVHAALGAIIGASTANAISSEKSDTSLQVEKQQRTSDDVHQGLDCEREGRPAKRRKSFDFIVRPNLSDSGDIATLVDMKTQVTDMDTKAQATHTTAEAVRKEASDSILLSLSMHKLENEPDCCQQKDSGTTFLCDQTIPCQERSHALLQVTNKTTANVASCWLELLRLDIKGRLSALKRSRRRLRSVIASGQLEGKMCCADDAFQTTSRFDMAGEGKRDSQTVEVDKWRVFFLHMDGVLHSEGARLENWLNQIDEMWSHCQKRTPSCL